MSDIIIHLQVCIPSSQTREKRMGRARWMDSANGTPEVHSEHQLLKKDSNHFDHHLQRRHEVFISFKWQLNPFIQL